MSVVGSKKVYPAGILALDLWGWLLGLGLSWVPAGRAKAPSAAIHSIEGEPRWVNPHRPAQAANLGVIPGSSFPLLTTCNPLQIYQF